jgi:hypothetical protein
VKRIFSIIFFLVYLTAYGEGHQLMRIPYLVKHFKVHQQNDPDMAFAKFIKIHYLQPIQVDDDFQQDQQLPFRTIDCNMLFASFCYTAPATIDIKLPEFTTEKTFTSLIVFIPEYKTFGVFQPPRYARI